MNQKQDRSKFQLLIQRLEKQDRSKLTQSLYRFLPRMKSMDIVPAIKTRKQEKTPNTFIVYTLALAKILNIPADANFSVLRLYISQMYNGEDKKVKKICQKIADDAESYIMCTEPTKKGRVEIKGRKECMRKEALEALKRTKREKHLVHNKPMQSKL